MKNKMKTLMIAAVIIVACNGYAFAGSENGSGDYSICGLTCNGGGNAVKEGKGYGSRGCGASKADPEDPCGTRSGPKKDE